jgi:XTP/dITP diphosphohydrolase
MDQLRSPGGCPWDAEQTHLSLAPYLIEEAYETLEAIETADMAGLREELGDVLLQVLFHARVAEDAAPDQRFTIAEVANDLVAKLTRRHPHVFADPDASKGGASLQGRPRAVHGLSADEVNANWDALKKIEKQRESVTDGIPMGLPALSLAAKLFSRSSRAGVSVSVPTGDGVGDRLFALVTSAVQAGIDPELALRDTARHYREAIRTAEREAVPSAEPEAVGTAEREAERTSAPEAMGTGELEARDA